MRYLLALLVLSSTAFAGDKPDYRIGIDGKKHYINGIGKHTFVPPSTGITDENPEVDKIVKEIASTPSRKPIIIKGPRLWVQDVYQDGLWYYGYYVSVDGQYEFRYSRREYKGALTNFRSLYSVYYKYELRNAAKPPVKVIYESAY